MPVDLRAWLARRGIAAFAVALDRDPTAVALARRERLTVLASASTPGGASGFANRLVAIADGLLVFDGLPTDFSGQRVAWRFGTA